MKEPSKRAERKTREKSCHQFTWFIHGLVSVLVEIVKHIKRIWIGTLWNCPRSQYRKYCILWITLTQTKYIKRKRDWFIIEWLYEPLLKRKETNNWLEVSQSLSAVGELFCPGFTSCWLHYKRMQWHTRKSNTSPKNHVLLLQDDTNSMEKKYLPRNGD